MPRKVGTLPYIAGDWCRARLRRRLELGQFEARVVYGQSCYRLHQHEQIREKSDSAIGSSSENARRVPLFRRRKTDGG